jgi:HAD superfamily hydrolase (TIGR01509 family)
MSRAILFDFNGVISNDEPVHCRAFLATLGERGVRLTEQDYRERYLGLDDRDCFRKAWDEAGKAAPAPTELAGLIARKNQLFETMITERPVLVEGAREFLADAARRGYRIAVVSGALRREIDLVLRVSGLSNPFEFIISAEDVVRSKPDPAGYLMAMARFGVKPDQTMVLEDSLPGLAAARAAGVLCTMLSTSHPADTLAAADAVWPHFAGRTAADLPWNHG